MALTSDTKLGRYEIIWPLGAGGMEEDNGTARVGLGLSGLTWSRDGKPLYLRDAAGGLMAVDVQPQADQFYSGPPGGFSLRREACDRAEGLLQALQA